MSHQNQLAREVVKPQEIEIMEDGVQVLSKVIAVEIKGTMNGFSVMGPSAATWKPVEGKSASIFGIDSNNHTMDTDFTAATNSIKNATIRKATLLQTYNTFSVPLGVSINCLPSNEVVETGDKYTFTTIPNTAVNTPSLLFEAGESQSQASEWRRNYARWTTSNLETQDVLKVPNCPYVFVHEAHPVINLLRMNKHLLGVDIDTTEKMDGQWYKITQPLMDSSCETLRSKILSKIETKDLNNLQLQLHRVGGGDWAHVTATDALMTFNPHPSWSKEETKLQLQAHQKLFTEKPSVFMARIHLVYEVQK